MGIEDTPAKGEELLKQVENTVKEAEPELDLGLGDEDEGAYDTLEDEFDDEKPVSIYAKYEMDKTMEQQGIIVDLGAAGRFKVARAGSSNVEYTRCVAAQGKKAGVKRIKNNKLSDEEAHRRMAFIYGSTIIKGWEGVYGRDMKPIPYSKEAAVKLLTDLPELMNVIVTESHRADNYRKEYVEEASGNS